MSFLVWLEASALGEWVRASYTGYPIMIACHAIGMAIMVGLGFALSLRLLGWFREIPYAGISRFLGIAWAGFAINTISGSALFAAQATTYISDGTFLLKIALVFGGVITVAMQQSALNRQGGRWENAGPPAGIRIVAWASIVCWVGATVTGRLIAYL